MVKPNTCAILESGRIKTFTNMSLLANYIGTTARTINRWRTELEKNEKPPIKYVGGIMIDFSPESFNNKK